MPPVISPAEVQTRATFLALMWALSRPGLPQEMPRHDSANGLSNFIAVGNALLDLETSFYTRHPELAQHLGRTGARLVEPARAAYLFFPQLEDHDLADVEQAAVGDYLYPDRAATLVIACNQHELGAARLRLSGPGIPDVLQVHIGGLPGEFWPLRESRLHYPLGWDLFLLSQQHVIGLPRTTRVAWEAC